MDVFMSVLGRALGTLVWVFLGGNWIGNSLQHYQEGEFSKAGWDIMFAVVAAAFLFKMVL